MLVNQESFLRAAAAFRRLNAQLVVLLKPKLDAFIAELLALPSPPARAGHLVLHHTLKKPGGQPKIGGKKEQQQAVKLVEAGTTVVALGAYSVFSCFTPFGAPNDLTEWDGTIWFNLMEQCSWLSHPVTGKLPKLGQTLFAVPAPWNADSYMKDLVTPPQQLRGARNAASHKLFMNMDPSFLIVIILPVMKELLTACGGLPSLFSHLAEVEHLLVTMLTASEVQQEVAMMALAATRDNSETLVEEVRLQLATGVEQYRQACALHQATVSSALTDALKALNEKAVELSQQVLKVSDLTKDIAQAVQELKDAMALNASTSSSKKLSLLPLCSRLQKLLMWDRVVLDEPSSSQSHIAASPSDSEPCSRPLRVLLLSPIAEQALQLSDKLRTTFGLVGSLPWDLVIDFGPTKKTASSISALWATKAIQSNIQSSFSLREIMPFTLDANHKTAFSESDFVVQFRRLRLGAGCRWISIGDSVQDFIQQSAGLDFTNAWKQCGSAGKCSSLMASIWEELRKDPIQFRQVSVVTVVWSEPAWFAKALDSAVRDIGNHWDINLEHLGLLIGSRLRTNVNRDVFTSLILESQANESGSESQWAETDLPTLCSGAMALCDQSSAMATATGAMEVPVAGNASKGLTSGLAQSLQELGVEVIYVRHPIAPPRATKAEDDKDLREFLRGGQLSWSRMLMNPLNNLYDLRREGIRGPTSPLVPARESDAPTTSHQAVSSSSSSKPKAAGSATKLKRVALASDQFETHVRDVVEQPFASLAQSSTNGVTEVRPNLIRLLHLRSAGATTLCRRVLFNLRLQFPCVQLHRADCDPAKVAEQLCLLNEETERPVLALLDDSVLFTSHFIETLRSCCFHCPITFLVTEMQSPGVLAPVRPREYFLGHDLNHNERCAFQAAFRPFLATDASNLNNADSPIFFGLIAFFDDYRQRFNQFLNDAIDRQLEDPGKRILLFIIFAEFYSAGKRPLNPTFYRSILQPLSQSLDSESNELPSDSSGSIDLFTTSLLSPSCRQVLRLLLRRPDPDGPFVPPVQLIVPTLLEKLLCPLVSERSLWREKLLFEWGNPSSEEGFLHDFIRTLCRARQQHQIDLSDELLQFIFLVDFSVRRDLAKDGRFRPVIHDALKHGRDAKAACGRMVKIYDQLVAAMPKFRGDYVEHRGIFLCYQCFRYPAAKASVRQACDDTKTSLSRRRKILTTRGYLCWEQLKATLVTLEQAPPLSICCYVKSIVFRFFAFNLRVGGHYEVARTRLFVTTQHTLRELIPWMHRDSLLQQIPGWTPATSGPGALDQCWIDPNIPAELDAVLAATTVTECCVYDVANTTNLIAPKPNGRHDDLDSESKDDSQFGDAGTADTHVNEEQSSVVVCCNYQVRDTQGYQASGIVVCRFLSTRPQLERLTSCELRDHLASLLELPKPLSTWLLHASRGSPPQLDILSPMSSDPLQLHGQAAPDYSTRYQFELSANHVHEHPPPPLQSPPDTIDLGSQWATCRTLRDTWLCEDAHWLEVFAEGCKAFDEARVEPEDAKFQEKSTSKYGYRKSSKLIRADGALGLVKLIVTVVQLTKHMFRAEELDSAGDSTEQDRVMSAIVATFPRLRSVLPELTQLPRLSLDVYMSLIPVAHQLLDEVRIIRQLSDGTEDVGHRESVAEISSSLLQLRDQVHALLWNGARAQTRQDSLLQYARLTAERNASPETRVFAVENWLRFLLRTKRIGALGGGDFAEASTQLLALLSGCPGVMSPYLLHQTIDCLCRSAAENGDDDGTLQAQWLLCLDQWAFRVQNQQAGIHEIAFYNVNELIRRFPWPDVHRAYQVWAGNFSLPRFELALAACKETGRAMAAVPLYYIARPDLADTTGLGLLISHERLRSLFLTHVSESGETDTADAFWKFCRQYLLRFEGMTVPVTSGSRIKLHLVPNETVFYESIRVHGSVPEAEVPCTFFLGCNYKSLSARDVLLRTHAERDREKFPGSYLHKNVSDGDFAGRQMGKIIKLPTKAQPLYTLRYERDVAMVSTDGTHAEVLCHEQDIIVRPPGELKVNDQLDFLLGDVDGQTRAYRARFLPPQPKANTGAKSNQSFAAKAAKSATKK